jgi:hypothetical protein
MNPFEVYAELLALPNVVITGIKITPKVIEIFCTLSDKITYIWMRKENRVW